LDHPLRTIKHRSDENCGRTVAAVRYDVRRHPPSVHPACQSVSETDVATPEALVGTKAESITPNGTTSSTFQAIGFIVNCRIVSIFANS
jgi:hypothetical protein